jgi:DNA sulfur modification protein DndD
MRELDLSAGEQQIFALALISAVARVSGRDFPVIVDTPLARLDKEHRLGVLRHFTEQSRQVILLSTDTEVVGEYLDAVRDRVANSYLLKHEHDGDIGRSWPVEGYFTGQEI